MPDQLTPAQAGEPWEEGDVFAVQHGPHVPNLFFFRHQPDDTRSSGLVDDGMTRFAAEVAAFVEREKARQ